MAELILTCVITKEKGRYASVCPELDVASMGDTPEEAQKNLEEAVIGHLGVAREEGLLSNILDKLGITKKDLSKKEHILPVTFSSSISIPIPA